MPIVPLLILALANPAPVPPQTGADVPETSLDDAIETGLGLSPSVDAAGFRRRARVEEEGAGWDRFLPRLRVQSSAWQRQDPIAGPFLSFFQPDAVLTSQLFNAGLSVESVLPVGTRFSLGLDQSVGYYSSLTESLNPRLEPRLRLRVSQPIWGGLLPSVNLAPITRNVARADAELGAYLEETDRTAKLVADAWIAAARARALLVARERSLELGAEFEKVTKALIKGGEMSRLDLALAKQTLAARAMALEQTRRDAAATVEALAAAMNVEPGEVFVPRVPADVRPFPITVEQAVERALAADGGLIRLRGRIKELEAQANQLADRARPDLALGLEGSLSGLAGQSTCVGGYLADGVSPCGVHPDYQGGLDQAFSNLGAAQLYAVGVTLSGTLPLFPSVASAPARAARHDVGAARRELDQRVLAIRHRAGILVRNVARDRLIHEQALAAVKLSEDALDAQDKKLRAGRSTTFDLVRAQELLIASQLQEVGARMQLEASIVEVRALMGRLAPAARRLDPSVE